ncbi:hypothetical protein M0804_002716 [Polistes exclamans]|nr:hypothetical protein M0804_002716 [Polistes exclamans]
MTLVEGRKARLDNGCDFSAIATCHTIGYFKQWLIPSPPGPLPNKVFQTFLSGSLTKFSTPATKTTLYDTTLLRYIQH